MAEIAHDTSNDNGMITYTLENNGNTIQNRENENQLAAETIAACISEQQESEQHFLKLMQSAHVLGAEDACFIVFPIDNMGAFVVDPNTYVDQKLQGPGKEVNFRKLTPEDQELMKEAMAREISEVLRSKSLRALQEHVPDSVLRERCLPMRWILTWKPVDPPQKPANDGKPTVLRPDGLMKAKARIILIGYKHPDLAVRDERTGRQRLQTSSPTLSRIGRQQFLQATAIDRHTLESADAKSAFLQADQGIGTEALYTWGVPELQYAYGISRWEALQVLGAIYGLTSAPRIFWKDAHTKVSKLGARVHCLDKCIWLILDGDRVVGRIAAHVDDFLIAGDSTNGRWIQFRNQLKKMYEWSPWQSGTFTFAGCELRQTKDFTIYLTQSTFCNALRPVIIENEASRPTTSPLTAAEATQCRGLTMKAQWRAIQSAPQYCARIGLLASSLKEPTLKELKEANSIMRELRKTAKEDIVFHTFAVDNKKIRWQDIVALHFGDASQHTRPCGGSTGGYVTGFTDQTILKGCEAKVTIIDWRSWKLDRPAKGSNSAEGQAIYETEDRGWKNRLFWAIINGEKLTRRNANDLARMIESLLVMDSRGCYGSITTSDSVMLGMANARTGVEMLHVQRGTDESSRCYPTWVPGDLNLSDSMTKNTYEAYKVMALYHSKKSWVVRFNQEFVSARKQQRLRRQAQLEDQKTIVPAMSEWPDENPALVDQHLLDTFPERI